MRSSSAPPSSPSSPLDGREAIRVFGVDCSAPRLIPRDIFVGAEARSARRDGDAGRLGGDDERVFGSAILIERDGDSPRRRRMSYRRLRESEDGSLREALEGIEATRAAMDSSGGDWGSRVGPHVMGIINVTSDSFSDGALCEEPDKALSAARRMIDEGATILDVGGESTRPGASPIPLAMELNRLSPVLERLGSLGVPLSCDTRKAGAMRAAASYGAAILNDVSALCYDADSPRAAVELGLPVVLMHFRGDPQTMQDDPQYDDVLLDVLDELEGLLRRAASFGVGRGEAIVDPGIGFAKSFDHNLILLRDLSAFHVFGSPLLFGASRKGFLGALCDEPIPSRRKIGSAVVAAEARRQGARILRVHDVKATFRALRTSAAFELGSSAIGF